MERAKVRARTREGDRKQRAESGGKEGSGGGDGEGDGGNPSFKGNHQGGGPSFTSGRVDVKLKSKIVGHNESGARVQSGPSSRSYRDKLLSPGCAGFLIKHSEEDDIMQGWKDYFHKMNEKDVSCDSEESEKEETQEARRLEGKPGTIKFSAEEYTAWCLPWMNSLIIKVLGASFPTYIIRDRINRMWRPRDPLKLIPLNNGYYIVSFSNKEDKEYAFQEGPWMIEDHYLIVQRWHPNFNPWKADLKCNIAAWIRLPDVPFEFYNVESLRRIGGTAGDERDAVSPFGKLQILRRDFSGAFNSAGIRKGNNGVMAQDMTKELKENQIPSQRLKSRRTVMAGSEFNKKGVVNVGESIKSEWVQVGSKRKGSIKGKLKGKENKTPSRGNAASELNVGKDMEPTTINGNSFNILQQLEPNRVNLVDPQNVMVGTNEGIIMSESQGLNGKIASVSSDKITLPQQSTVGTVTQVQDNSLSTHQVEDELMRDQDKAEGEPATPQHTPLVS
ncbi:hypothetical protein K1719_000677 [Acacia pycnantha]|nr:hypothetical protein K1719_000677 [Acacia pycnantha]